MKAPISQSIPAQWSDLSADWMTVALSRDMSGDGCALRGRLRGSRHAGVGSRWQWGGVIAAALLILAASAQGDAGVTSDGDQEPGSRLTTTETAPEPVSDSRSKPASVLVEFGTEQGDLLRTERFNTWDNGDPAPDLRADDVGFPNDKGLHSKIVRIGFTVDELLARWTQAKDDQIAKVQATFVRHQLSTCHIELPGEDNAMCRTDWVAYSESEE